MSDHANQPRAGSDAKPVIPDGGLGSSMPAWLRQPPAWKQAASAQVQREVPAPDTSTIDPSTFLEIDDLPAWLQAVARRVEVNAGRGSNGRPAHDCAGRHVAVEAAAVAPAEQELAPSTATPGPDSGAESKTLDVPPLAPSSPSPAWWMSEQVVGGLMLAVVIVLIYVILVATEVL